MEYSARRIHTSDIFGIGKNKEEKLLRFFEEANLKSETMTELAERIGLLKGEETYIAYLYGRQIQRNEQMASIAKYWKK